jgi:hypothetical protein
VCRVETRRLDWLAVTNAENNYDYAGQDPVNGYDLDGTLMNADVGGGQTVEGNLCGPHGTNSCLGTEGDATDKIFSTQNVIINIGLFALPGVGEVVWGSRAAKAASVLGKTLAAGRVAKAALAADRAGSVMGPGAGTLGRIVQVGVFLARLVDDRASLIKLREILHLPYRGGAGWPGFPR